MPQLKPLDLREISVGESSTFRNDINYNFQQVAAYFEVFHSGPQIILSKDEPAPGVLQPSDFWYKILD